MDTKRNTNTWQYLKVFPWGLREKLKTFNCITFRRILLVFSPGKVNTGEVWAQSSAPSQHEAKSSFVTQRMPHWLDLLLIGFLGSWAEKIKPWSCTFMSFFAMTSCCFADMHHHPLKECHLLHRCQETWLMCGVFRQSSNTETGPSEGGWRGHWSGQSVTTAYTEGPVPWSGQLTHEFSVKILMPH